MSRAPSHAIALYCDTVHDSSTPRWPSTLAPCDPQRLYRKSAPFGRLDVQTPTGPTTCLPDTQTVVGVAAVASPRGRAGGDKVTSLSTGVRPAPGFGGAWRGGGGMALAWPSPFPALGFGRRWMRRRGRTGRMPVRKPWMALVISPPALLGRGVEPDRLALPRTSFLKDRFSAQDAPACARDDRLGLGLAFLGPGLGSALALVSLRLRA